MLFNEKANQKSKFLNLRDINEKLVEITKTTYQENASTYAEMWEWRKGAIQKATVDLLQPFRNLIKAGDLVLVAGCGTGRDINYLMSHDVRCLGIDFSESMLVEALKRGVSSPLVVMDIRDLKLIRESFEGVFCETALEHIPKIDLLNTLKGFYRVLKPEGYSLFGFRDGDGRVFVTKDIGGARYFVTYTENEVTRTIEEAGFQIHKVLKAKHAIPKRPGFINYLVKKI